MEQDVPDAFEEDSEEEREDYTIRKSDHLIVAATTDNDFSNLEIYVFDETTSNLYVHHEIMLSSYPLAIEWLSADLTGKASGNFAIVGTFLPEIQIWNLDIMDAVEPAAVLGGEPGGSSSNVSSLSKKKSKSKGSDSHTDAVMALALHPVDKRVLASGSADTSVKLWDISKQKCTVHCAKHTDKVQVVRWSAETGSLLLSAGYDRTACLFDSRKGPNADAASAHIRAEVESATWQGDAMVLLSYESGVVEGYDVRKFSKPLFVEENAHDKAVTGLAISPAYPELLTTCSLDQTVAVWRLSAAGLSLVQRKEMQAGELFGVRFCQDAGNLLACGGSTGALAVWDIEESAAVVKAFGMKVSVA